MSNEAISADTLRFLIEQKVSYINAVVNICMLWWASSIVFSGSVLAGVWSQQEALKRQQRFIHGLGVVLFVFFFVIAYFGHIVAVRVGGVQHEIAVMARQLHFEDANLKDGFFETERRTFQISMWLGAGSFALIWLAWVVFWASMSRRRAVKYILTWGVLWLLVWCFLRWRGLLP